ncbi:hypothetical protein F4806DRAFT_58906 [Annulohypoxylon nitens]|nr:hypothetical protein F4806DRAFT_58906 [Annulohypoxylon nitens]
MHMVYFVLLFYPSIVQGYSLVFLFRSRRVSRGFQKTRGDSGIAPGTGLHYVGVVQQAKTLKDGRLASDYASRTGES